MKFTPEDFEKDFPDNLWPSLKQSLAAREILAALCNAKLEAWLKEASNDHQQSAQAYGRSIGPYPCDEPYKRG